MFFYETSVSDNVRFEPQHNQVTSLSPSLHSSLSVRLRELWVCLGRGWNGATHADGAGLNEARGLCRGVGVFAFSVDPDQSASIRENKENLSRWFTALFCRFCVKFAEQDGNNSEPVCFGTKNQHLPHYALWINSMNVPFNLCCLCLTRVLPWSYFLSHS